MILTLLFLQAPSADQILENVRRAVGYEQFAQSRFYEARGTTLSSGVESGISFSFGHSGEYVFSVDGPLSQTRAWDGKSGWETDFGGAPISLALSDLEHQHAISWVFDHEWLDPQGPFVIKMDAASSGGDSYTLNLKLRDGIHVQKVVVDKKTWMPIETSFAANGLKVLYSFSSWMDGKGFKFPKRIDTLEGELKGWIEMASCKAVSTISIDRPNWSLTHDTVWGGSGLQEIETKKTRTGHLLVKPTIGGKDVGWFILDSGAGGMAIDNAVAEELGGKKFGEINVGGVGGIEQGSYVTLKDFQLGDMSIKSVNYIGIDLSMIGRFFGVKLGGIVGYEFFRRAVTEIDLDKGTVSIADPSKYERMSDSWIPLVLDGRHPTFIGEFEGGHSGRFRLDTGANGAVTFNMPTVERCALLENRETKKSALGGVGGMVSVQNGVLDYFSLSGKRIDKVQASFATAAGGVFGEDYLAGNIGQDLLTPFLIVFDYANERIALISKE